MNLFRLAGDLSHLFAIIILLLKIWHTQSCAGLSGRTQLLFLITYVTRYLDLVVNFVSLYNTAMKIFFIVSATATVYFIFWRFRSTYNKNYDTLRMEFLLLPCAVLALVLNHDFTALEVLWTFSIYLEAVAILPQLFMITKTGEAETITNHYLFALGMYRAFYILNWIYRYHEENFFDEIATVAGIVQTVCYCDFFYLYVTKGGFSRPGSSDPSHSANQRWYTALAASHLGPWAFRSEGASKQMAALDSMPLSPLKSVSGKQGGAGTLPESEVPLLQAEEEAEDLVSCSDLKAHDEADDAHREPPPDLIQSETW